MSIEELVESIAWTYVSKSIEVSGTSTVTDLYPHNLSCPILTFVCEVVLRRALTHHRSLHI